MNRVLLLLFIAIPSTFLTPGCIFSKKPKPNPDIAAEVEETFKQRWIARRMGELIAGGQVTDGRTAREQAVKEFAEKYEYTTAAKGYGK
ncbi:MAG TPA: hypothetical protein PLV87_00485 [Opitutaceae bacterium]|nr:hypothetical protein [Opitutaceae bacterium]